MSEEHDGLVSAYLLDGRGGGTAATWVAIRRWTPDDGLLWTHLDYTAPAARRWLTDESGLDEVAADALLAEETRPRSVGVGKGLLVTLRGVNTNPGEDPEDMVSLRIWIEPSRIISTRRRRLLSVQDVRDAIAAGQGPGTPGEFLVQIADRLATRMRDAIERIGESVDELEGAVMSAESHRLRGALAEVRRKAIMLRRYLAPQRDALARLYTERMTGLSDADRMRLREIADTVTRYLEELDEARERAGVANEELGSRLSEQLNARMYLLSMIAAIFLPLGFLTGLLGINVGGIPGAENQAAFAGVTLLLIGVVVIELIVFRWRKWF